jgi:hypothetical protein
MLAAASLTFQEDCATNYRALELISTAAPAQFKGLNFAIYR